MIQFTDVSKVFQSGRGTVGALHDVSFVIDSCRFAVVIGKSGSGKSTLLNCMGGLEPPDAGQITCFGTALYTLGNRERSMFQRRHVGFVFQRATLLSYLTVAENIGFPLTLNNMVGRDRERRIDELLDRIDLGQAARALPHELSGGEAQRVAIARAIAHRPKLVLADEPTANLDTQTGQRTVQLMRDMGRDQGCTLIMATHDLDITHAADALIRLKDGRVQEVK